MQCKLVISVTALALGLAACSSSTKAPPSSGAVYYTRTLSTTRVPQLLGASDQPVWLLLRQSVETWVAADGTTRTRTISLSRTFAGAADRALWQTTRQPLPLNADSDTTVAGFPGTNNPLFSAAQLRTLPLGPGPLLLRLHAAEQIQQQAAQANFARSQLYSHGPGITGHVSLFTMHPLALPSAFSDLAAIGSLLTTPLPTQLRVALVRLARTLPDVSLRHSQQGAVTISAAHAQSIEPLLIDAANDELLTTPTGATVLAQGAVESLTALPAGVAPVPGPASLKPLSLRITPLTGGAHTAFKLHLSGNAAGVFTLTDDCAGALAQAVRPLRPAADSYTLTPQYVGLRQWCTGRNAVLTEAVSGASATAYFSVS